MNLLCKHPHRCTYRQHVLCIFMWVYTVQTYKVYTLFLGSMHWKRPQHMNRQPTLSHQGPCEGSGMLRATVPHPYEVYFTPHLPVLHPASCNSARHRLPPSVQLFPQLNIQCVCVHMPVRVSRYVVWVICSYACSVYACMCVSRYMFSERR